MSRLNELGRTFRDKIQQFDLQVSYELNIIPWQSTVSCSPAGLQCPVRLAARACWMSASVNSGALLSNIISAITLPDLKIVQWRQSFVLSLIKCHTLRRSSSVHLHLSEPWAVFIQLDCWPRWWYTMEWAVPFASAAWKRKMFQVNIWSHLYRSHWIPHNVHFTSHPVYFFSKYSFSGWMKRFVLSILNQIISGGNKGNDMTL